MDNVATAMLYLANKVKFELSGSIEGTASLRVGDIELCHEEIEKLISELVRLVGSKAIEPMVRFLVGKTRTITNDLAALQENIDSILENFPECKEGGK